LDWTLAQKSVRVTLEFFFDINQPTYFFGCQWCSIV